VDWAPRRSSQGHTLYAPVVRFADGRGAVHQFRDSAASNPPAYRRGEAVAVLYDPRNPQIAMMAGWRSHITGGILATLGLFLRCWAASFCCTSCARGGRAAKRGKKSPCPLRRNACPVFTPAPDFPEKTMSTPQYPIAALLVLLATLAGSATAQQPAEKPAEQSAPAALDEHTREDIARHRAMAQAHAAAAQCLQDGTAHAQCQKQLQADCKGLALGKHCGMRHGH